jgi:hypothetical protein
MFGGSQHHPLALAGAAIFIVGLIYFIFIKNPKILDKLLGRNLSDIGPGNGFVGATVGATVAGPNIYTPTGDISTGAVIAIRSGGSSFRDNVSYDSGSCARETTWFFIPVVGPALTSGVITVRSSGTSFRDNQGYDCSKCAREIAWFFIPGTEGDMSIKMGSHGNGVIRLL